MTCCLCHQQMLSEENRSPVPGHPVCPGCIEEYQSYRSEYNRMFVRDDFARCQIKQGEPA